MEDATQSHKILTRVETAKMLNISVMTLYTWTRTGLLTAYKIGKRHVYYKYDEILAALTRFDYNK